GGAATRNLVAGRGATRAERPASLCHHHRTAIRDAARAMNKEQGEKDPGPFDPTKALRAEPVAKLMERVLALMPELPPAKAEFGIVTIRYLDDKKAERDKWEVRGWLLRKAGDQVEIYTPHGRWVSSTNGRKPETTVPEPVPSGGVRFHDIDVTTEVTVTPQDIEELVGEVERSRKKGSAGSDLSERGR